MAWITWPAVVVILVLFFLVLFRKPIARFIDRTRQVKVPGGKLITGASGQETAVEAKPKEAEDLMKVFDNRLVLVREAEIKRHLIIPPGPQREDFLIRASAVVSLALAFEKVYWRIYGS